MDELDLMSDAEFFRTAFRLLGEQPAHVDAGADDSVIACPRAQHLPRTAAEVEHPGARFQTQGRAEGGELFGGERVVDAVRAFGDGEDPWDVQGRKTPYGGEWIWALPGATDIPRAATDNDWLTAPRDLPRC